LKRLVALLVAMLSISAPAFADHKAGHNAPPGPAPARFPSGFRAPIDTEWKFKVGGFGGKLSDDSDWDVVHVKHPETHYPVIFVHGNTVDHADWYPVRDAFVNAGWNALDLWALSYNGLGSENGTDGTTNPRRDDEHINNPSNDFGARVTSNDVNVRDLYNFVQEVRRFRRQPKFSIVSHSLGVTVARKMLKVYPALRRDVVTFVALAGGNHGTSLCPPGSEDQLNSCDEIAKDTPWLAKLNGPDGSDETYGSTRFLTVYDGSGLRDAAYVGPDYASSPMLKGAVNCAIEHHHNDLRIHPASIKLYRKFLELAERGITDRDCS
jgi:pimeloyl-ACP methyl ester carboxylesterase